ncbi:hypothetical protein L1987_36640 [Smallanthus sonchifolius]|uniref:Uncharacterized protein n=1 Tax=Smallanthus sonchifolius TaxID=185202 RepID=A0ACB9HFV1_9ASTR|nr:hypothetical protein L1987_36640 [Smallanthus sonchifolius]
MATQTPESINAKRASVSMHHVTSRYLRPSMGSCHDRCKHGMKDEAELKRPTRRLGVRKMLVKRNKVKRNVEPVERKNTKIRSKPKPSTGHKIRACEPVKVIKREKSLPSERIGVSVYGLLTNRKATQNELKLAKNNVKAKPNSSSILNGQKNRKEIKNTGNPTSVEQVASGLSPRNNEPVSPLKEEHGTTKTELNQLIAEQITEMAEMTLQEAENAEMGFVPLPVEIESPLKEKHSMTETKLKQLIAEKITEMTLQEAENAELEFVPLTVEIESPPTVTTKSTNLPSSESVQSSSDKQVLEEHENANNEDVIVSEDDYKMVVCEDKENGGSEVKFMRGRVVKGEFEDDGTPRKLKLGRGKIPEDEDDGPRRLKFRRGKILEGDEDDGPVRLKFRRGKILEDNDDDQSIDKINFKKKVVEEEKDDCKTESETVTLKHQEMQEKKEAQELLNHVIEETASKLEDDRKTKVEALVGAFETVISLQDDTPSSQS